MSKVFTGALLCIGTALYAAGALAASPESSDDVRCLIVAIGMLEAPSSSSRAAALPAALYYLGKLDGREPKADLESLIVAEQKKMRPEDFQAAAQRCGTTLVARGAVITAIGKKVIWHGATEPPQKESSSGQ